MGSGKKTKKDVRIQTVATALNGRVLLFGI
jgi:hypothetical protein